MRVRDWKLRTKQHVSFGLVMLVMAAVHFYTIHKMRAINDELEEVSSNWLPRALAISDVSLSCASLRTNQLKHALAPDADTRDQLTVVSINQIDQINGSLDRYRELRTQAVVQDRFAAEERHHYGAFDEAWEEYQDLSFTFYGLLSDGRTPDAVKLLSVDAQHAFTRLSASLEELVALNQLESLQAAGRAAQTFHSTRGISTLLLLVTIGLSICIAAFLVHLITVPVTQLERASGEVARGDLNVQLTVRGADEIGNLARSFNQMTGALREARIEREQQATKLREQNQELAVAMRELEEAQQQLLLREKMASLGDLVAGVTHELNTPIGAAHSAVDVIRRCTERLEASLQAHPEWEDARRAECERSIKIMRQNLDTADTATSRIQAIIASLKNFARLDEAEHQRVDVHEGLESTLTLMNAEFVGRIQIERKYGEVPTIECFPSQLNQVFQIVLKNSVAAIDGEGHITIETIVQDEIVCIQIADDGRGIEAERIDGLFGFGFSSAGGRVRLTAGLPTAYNIMQRHGGQIRLESEPARGTRVFLDLPVA
ncbi:MAG: HAMP domain-containing protein [Gemmatimonadetes bacterium]|nr:HAMP domain-containing protein [Gemmatimonadota bacterium]MBT5146334.1 HAMP domain-containing protein [Gemmatimonadota bacterium]MBT5591257.1 HAMP domain-containing protein [Gemmatimonadota bacterium]MBT5962288.1 HAMP domain-containing protein [Gemmatimonadota bacterium]MBT6629921.1 HAMP domain-containing protein [Gemmatimonadota bacterium]